VHMPNTSTLCHSPPQPKAHMHFKQQQCCEHGMATLPSAGARVLSSCCLLHLLPGAPVSGCAPPSAAYQVGQQLVVIRMEHLLAPDQATQSELIRPFLLQLTQMPTEYKPVQLPAMLPNVHSACLSKENRKRVLGFAFRVAKPQAVKEILLLSKSPRLTCTAS